MLTNILTYIALYTLATITIMPKKKKKEEEQEKIVKKQDFLEEIIEIEGVKEIEFKREPTIQEEIPDITPKDIELEEAEEKKEEFVPIPLEVCSNMYGVLMELAHSFRHEHTKPLTEQQLTRQGKVIYEILLRYEVSFAHIDVVMFAIGIARDWKGMEVKGQKNEIENNRKHEK